jgi:hypothetical protein
MMSAKTLIRCGLVSSLLYVVIDIAAALSWPGYNYAAQAISEYGAVGAPTRSGVLLPFLLYNLLMLGFGIGVRVQAGLRATGSFLIAVGLIGLVATFFPMHMRGSPRDLSDTMHLVLTGLTVACIIGAIGSSARALGGGFFWYSVATIVIMLAFGLLAALQAPRLDAGLPTPGLGLFERINIDAWLLWAALLSIQLRNLRRPNPGSGSGVNLSRY